MTAVPGLVPGMAMVSTQQMQAAVAAANAAAAAQLVHPHQATSPAVSQAQTQGEIERCSPTRSVSSASPPSSMSSGEAGVPATTAACMEEAAEYLKELLLEKDNLEAALINNNGSSLAQDMKTQHALKLLEQGKTKKY